MKKVTKYNNKPTSTISFALALIVYGIIIYLLIHLLFYIYNHPLTETGMFQTNAMKYLYYFPTILFLIMFIFALVGAIKGFVLGKYKVNKINKETKIENPERYFRELPNNFGIGVNTLLINSQIENEKDIIAAILDLCSKGYLKLEKKENIYEIKVLKNPDQYILYSEEYILSSIIEENISNIDYNEWFRRSMEDGIRLGLYDHIKQTQNNNNNEIKNNQSQLFKISAIICSPIFLITILCIFSGIMFFPMLLISTMSFFGIYFILHIIYTVIIVFKFSTKIKNNTENQIYINILNNKLILTNNGATELSKLESFKNFLKDFGNFASKNPEEIVLWNRYLSYAQLFGLTKDIINTGYNQLINNSSFKIDDINNITLNNIKILDN